MSNFLSSTSVLKSNHRRSTSENNLLTLKNFDDELPLNASEKIHEKLETLKVRKDALEEAIEKRLNELRTICLKEGELTGILPCEYPLRKNEEPPVIRRRVQTKFTFSNKLLMKPKTSDEEKLTKLELEFEIQCKIVKATCKLCNEINIKKSIKKQRKQFYQQALAKLKDIEKQLQLTKKYINEASKKLQNNVQLVNNQNDLDLNNSIESNLNENYILNYLNSKNSNFSLNDDYNDEDEFLNEFNQNESSQNNCDLLCSISAPSTPIKNQFQINKILINNESNFSNNNHYDSNKIQNKILNRVTNYNQNNLNHHHKIKNNKQNGRSYINNNKKINDILKERNSNSNSPEYDTISSATSSFGSNHNLFINNYCKLVKKQQELNNYEEVNKNSPETEAKNIFGVPTRRSAIALNLSQDNINLIKKKQSTGGKTLNDILNLGKIEKNLKRHNSLDNSRKKYFLNSTSNDNNENECYGFIQYQKQNSNQFQEKEINHPSSPNPSLNQQPLSFLVHSNSNLNVKSNCQQFKSLNSINMAQRPLPSPPIEALKTKNISRSVNLNLVKQKSKLDSGENSITKIKEKVFPPPLNLVNPPEHLLVKHQQNFNNSHTNSCSIKSPSNVNKINFEKLNNYYIKKQPFSNISQYTINSMKSLDYDFSCINSYLEQQHDSVINKLEHQPDQQIKSVRSSIIRTQGSFSKNTCNDLQQNLHQQQQQQHSLPILPPRTPITTTSNKSNSQFNSLNSYSLNSFNSSASLSNLANNLISTNLNYANSNSISTLTSNNSSKLNKAWTETQIDEINTNSQNYVKPMKNLTLNETIDHVKLEDKQDAKHVNKFNFNQTQATTTLPSVTPVPTTPLTSLMQKQASQIICNYSEEEKPYELSDFYKYSQKHRKKKPESILSNNSNFETLSVSSNNSQHSNSISNYFVERINNNRNTDLINNQQFSTKTNENEQRSDSQTNFTLSEESFLIKASVADAFSDEMNAWCEEKYKTATLV